MKSSKMNRREFKTSVAVAVSATVIVACGPVASTPAPVEEPLPPGESPQPSTPGRLLKVFIVYDSVFGNTAKIAEALIDGIGIQGEAKIIKAPEAVAPDLENIDLLMVGSPTHGGTFTEPVKNFLNGIPKNSLQGMKAAAFDTGFSRDTQGAFIKIIIDIFGFAAPKIAEELGAKGAVVIAAETFRVLDTEGPLENGEIDRARKWAGELISKIINGG